MSIRIGSAASDPEIPKSASQSIGEGIGCLLACLGVTAVLWAISGFPGLPR